MDIGQGIPTQWIDGGAAAPPQMAQFYAPPSAPMMPMGGGIRPRGPSKTPRTVKEGDWECPEPSCGNINFSKRTKCNRCGIPKPKPASENIPAPHLGGPPGLFKQGDWPCPQCGNVNWARRDKCNICNAAKPSLKIKEKEPRTGRGGGHFDLQDPADRNEHHSDNEEYDEFGRKKKRKNAGGNNAERNSKHSHKSENLAYASDSNKLLKSAFPPAPKSDDESDSSSRSSSYSSRSASGSRYASRRTGADDDRERRRERERGRRKRNEKERRSRSRSRSRDRYY